MNKYFSLDEYEFYEKSENKSASIDYSISMHHALFDVYLGEHLGNKSIKSLEFFDKILSDMYKKATKKAAENDECVLLIRHSIEENNMIYNTIQHTKRFNIDHVIEDSDVYTIYNTHNKKLEDLKEKKIENLISDII